MTKHTKQDIYGTDRQRETPLHEADPTEMREGLDRWSREMRRVRYHAILFSLTALALVVFIVAMLMLYYGKPNFDAGEPVDPKTAEAARPDGSEETRDLYMMDEFSEAEPEPELVEGGMPLDEKWIKQAAFNLAQAERESKAGNLDESLSHYIKALTIFPSLKGLHKHMGLIYLKQNKFDSAAAAFEQAFLDDPASFGVANNLGVSYMQLEKQVDAEKLFLYALKTNPEYAPAMYNLATLYVKRGEFDKALPRLERHLELDKENTKAAFTYAYVLIQLEKWEDASVMLHRLAEQNPDSPPIYFRLAQALTRIDNADEAVKALERGTSLLDPRSALAWIKKTDDFAGLRDHPRFQALVEALGNQEEL